MIIIWRGFGILALLLPLIGAVITRGAVSGFLGEKYVSEHSWPWGAGVLIAAVALFFIALARDRDEPGRDALYYIPLKYWPFIIAPIGISCLFATPHPREAKARSNPNYQAPVAGGQGLVDTQQMPAFREQRPAAGQPVPVAKTGQPVPNSGNVSGSSPAPGITLGSSGITYDGQKWPPDPQPLPQQAQSQRRAANESQAVVEYEPNNTGLAKRIVTVTDINGNSVTRTQLVANLTLESIAYDPNGKSTAVFKGRRVKVGDNIVSYTVLSIQKDSVTLKSARGVKRTLRVGETEDPL